MATERARPSMPTRRSGRRRPIRSRRLLAALVLGAGAAGLPSPVIASSGGGRRITDADNTRTVYLVVAALVLLAIGLAVYTWWFWRSTRRDHEALAPLEVMTDRKFVDSDAVTRQVILDGSRPVGAAPLAPGALEPLAVVPDIAPITLGAAGADAADDETVAIAVVVADGPAVSADGSPIDADEAEVITGRTPAPGAVAALADAAGAEPVASDETSDLGPADAPPTGPGPEVDAPTALVASDASNAGDGEPDLGDGAPAAVMADASADGPTDVDARESIPVAAGAPAVAAVLDATAAGESAPPAVPGLAAEAIAPADLDDGVAEAVGGAATIGEALAKLRGESPSLGSTDTADDRSELPTMAVDAVPPGSSPQGGPRTAAMDVVVADPRHAAEPMPVIVPAFGPDARDPEQTELALGIERNGSAAGNGDAAARPAPIDPGLPVPPIEPPSSRQLSLAELAALDGGAPTAFDEDPLRRTPSMGVPVVESAEAWVERQLAAARAARAAASGQVTAAADAQAATPVADPTEPE